MNTQPIGLTSLLHSRRFRTMVVGIVTALIVYFVGKYYAVGLPDVQFIINTVTPLIGLLIVAYTVDDVAQSITDARQTMQQAQLAHDLEIKKLQIQSQMLPKN